MTRVDHAVLPAAYWRECVADRGQLEAEIVRWMEQL